MIVLKSALRFAYDGTAFEGYPPARDRRTVEGALIDGLEEQMDGVELWTGSRTDRGVSALGNVCAVTAHRPIDTGRLNASMADVVVTGIAPVDPDFNPRFAHWRWYRYLMTDPSVDPDLAAGCAKLFVGEHDFTNFSRRDDRDAVRKVIDVRVAEDPSCGIVLDIKGATFIWNMVRRIAGAVMAVGRGQVSMAEVGEALHRPDLVRSFGTAPPEALVLMDVDYPGVEFTGVPLGVRADGDLQRRLVGDAGPNVVARSLTSGVLPEW